MKAGSICKMMYILQYLRNYDRSKNMNQLKLGLPKGSLEKATIALFENAGWLIKPTARNYFPEIDDPELGLLDLPSPGDVEICGKRDA